MLKDLLRQAILEVQAEPDIELEELPHGTLHAYNHLKCRCLDCRYCFADYQAKRRQKIRLANPKEPRPKPTHGTNSMYSRHKCRCQLCLDWNTERMRLYRAKQKPEKHNAN